MESKFKSNNTQLIDDPRFRIKPVQQMAAACTGALITSFLGIDIWLY
jgi:solute carrier family 25, member 39/40